MRPRSWLPLIWLIALALAALLTLAACGDDDDDGDGEAPTAIPTTGETPAGETPSAIDISGVAELEDGVLTIGSDIAYAPIEFFEEGTETPAGLDVDLANAIGDVLGVEVEFVNSGFDGLIAALNTDEFDIVMSAMTITDERSAEVDFIPYLNVGLGILVPAGNPNNIGAIEDLCGLTIAVQLGTIQEQMVRDASEACDEPITVVTHDTNPLAVEELRTGGADANMADFPVAAFDAEQADGALEVVEPQVDPQPYGIALRMDADALMAVIEQALDQLRASGEYDRILAEWGLEATALD